MDDDMTERKAKEKIHNYAMHECENIPEDVIEALAVAMLALARRAPKKPVDIDEDLGIFRCPSCNEMIYTTDKFTSHKYCLNCGQAIDWGDYPGDKMCP